MRTLFVCLITFFSLSAPAQEFEGAAQPADVLVAVENFTADLEAIRLYMGKPTVTLSRFQVDFAAPRHVYYQAQTLFRKTDRLGQEVAGVTRQAPPPAPVGETLPEDVLRVVQLAQARLDLIRESLGVAAPEKNSRRNSRTQPKDVFEAMFQASRQINLIIDDPFRPADVHSQLSSANVYLASILAQAGEQGFPAVDFVPGKQPIDVYNLLIDCLDQNQKIGELLNVSTLQVNPRRLRRERSILSDNYDIATMLVSDIAHWTAQLEHDEDTFPQPETLRYIFPAHVVVKASMLQTQLQMIADRVADGKIGLAVNR